MMWRNICALQLALAKRQAADADGRAEAATSDLARLRKALLDAELEMQTLTQRLGERDRERTAAVDVADSASAKAQSAQARQADLESTIDELEKRLASERSKVMPCGYHREPSTFLLRNLLVSAGVQGGPLHCIPALQSPQLYATDMCWLWKAQHISRLQADTLDLEVHDKTLKLNKALASVAATEEEAAVERAALRSKAAALQDAQEAVATARKQCEALQRRHDEASGQLSEVQAMKHALQEEVRPLPCCLCAA